MNSCILLRVLRKKKYNAKETYVRRGLKECGEKFVPYEQLNVKKIKIGKRNMQN